MNTVSSKATAAVAGGVLLTLCAGQFLMMLDSSVMNVSIATVAKDVGTTVTGIQTAITLYTLVMAALMITGGKIGQIIGRKRAFAIGCVIYGCGSFITAISHEPRRAAARLVVPRGHRGGADPAGDRRAGGGRTTQRDERPRAYGLIASAAAIAIAVGPIIGGLFTTYLSWRYVFAGEVADRAGDPRPRPPHTRGRPRAKEVHLDLVGTALSALGLGLIVFGVLRSGVWGFVKPKPGAPEWIGLSPVIWLMLGGGMVLLTVHRVGGPADRPRRRAARRPQDPANVRVLRGGLTAFFFQYFVQGGAVLRGAAVPVGGTRALGDRDGGAAAAALDHADPRGSRHPEVLPERIAAPGRPARLRLRCSRAS